MKYPRLDYHQKRNHRFTPEDIEKIKRLHRQGQSVYSIAKEFGFSYNSTRKQVDDKFKYKVNNYSNKFIKNKYHTDPDFKKQINKTRNKNLKIQLKNHPKLEEYYRQKSILYKERQNN